MGLKEKRIEKFHLLATDPWYKNLYRRLRVSDHKFAEKFFAEHGHLDSNEYCMKVQRVFLNNKPSKNWTTLNELLLVSDVKE